MVEKGAGPNPYRAPLSTHRTYEEGEIKEVLMKSGDAFQDPDDIKEIDLPDDRDRWGRYKLKDPVTGDAVIGTRATTFAGVLQERTTLERWSERMTVIGMGRRPDLFALAHGKDVKRDRNELDKLVAQAKEAAGSSERANTGTAVHGYCEKIDGGEWALEDVPPDYRADAAAYSAELKKHGLGTHPHLIERITYVREFEVGGKFDRIYELPDGSYVIGDLKTGSSVKYAWGEIKIQLALYAHGVNTSGIWSKIRKGWDQTTKVREDIAIVAHLPAGEGRCSLYTVDIADGWRDAHTCHAVRQHRKRNKPNMKDDLVSGIKDFDSSTPEPATSWTERFAGATSRQELSGLYRDAQRLGLPAEDLETFKEVGLETIRRRGL